MEKQSRLDFLKIILYATLSVFLPSCRKKFENLMTLTPAISPDPTITSTPKPTSTETPTTTSTETPEPTPTHPPRRDYFYIAPHVAGLNETSLNDMISQLGRCNDVKLGFAHDIWYLKEDPIPLREYLQNVFSLSKKTNLPVFLQVNGGPYGGIPEMWMANNEIVEWDSTLSKIQRPYADHGRQFVALNHPYVLNQKSEQLRIVADEVADFYMENPQLIVGLGTDSEQHIDDDAGYHAADITKARGPSDPLYDYLSNMNSFREHLVQRHVEFLSRTIYKRLMVKGIPDPDKIIYTHQVGNPYAWSPQNSPGWTAFNEYSRPGFTLYGNSAIRIPKDVLQILSEHNNSPWASEEWHPWLDMKDNRPVPLDSDIWENSLINMIKNNCKVIVVYGWDISNFPGGITRFNYDKSTAIAGIRKVLAEYQITSENE